MKRVAQKSLLWCCNRLLIKSGPECTSVPHRTVVGGCWPIRSCWQNTDRHSVKVRPGIVHTHVASEVLTLSDRYFETRQVFRGTKSYKCALLHILYC